MRLVHKGACTNSHNPAITTYKSGDCFKSNT
jgi:hypothetical protein